MRLRFVKRVLRRRKPTGRGEAGFSLTEMLVTTLILGLASTLMATGIPAAIDAYQQTVRTANAQMALSTTVTALRSELGLATDVRTNSSDRVYYEWAPGCWASIGKSLPAGLDKQYYTGSPDGDDSSSVSGLSEDGTAEPLVTDSAIAEGLTVDLESFERDGNTVTVRLSVTDRAGNTLASVGDDGYRILTRFSK